MTKNFEEEWNDMSFQEQNVFVRDYLKSLSKWDLKRVLCDVLDVDNYMDDEGQRKAVEQIVNTR